MKKRECALILGMFIILMSGFIVSADETEQTNSDSDPIDRAYQCLEDEIDGKTSFSMDEAIFGALALGSKSELIEHIESEKHTSENCWPRNSCDVKRTAQVMLIYDRIGRNTESIQEWLLDQSKPAQDLVWYLQIDIQNREEAECQIRYDDNERSVQIKNDQTVEGNPGSCLRISDSGYWLEIQEDCLDREYEVSCEGDFGNFITSLIYHESEGDTIFVSSRTSSAPPGGNTQEQVRARCFGTGTSCDYEGNLWASLAMNKVNTETNIYVPYLLALESNNRRFFPNSFLYILQSKDEYFTDIVQTQRQGLYWEFAGSPGNRFYDTSLGMMALRGSGASELQNAREYMLNIQGNDGCWDNRNIRSTGFVLYSGWPKEASISPGNGDPGEPTPRSCEAEGFFCGGRISCLDGGGEVKNEFACTSAGEVCCSIDTTPQLCSDQGGRICSADQRCTGSTTSASDGTCCLAECEDVQPTINECAEVGGVCRSECFSDEERIFEECPVGGQVCCQEIIEEDGGISWLLIFILLILIALVVLGIVYRDKLRLWLHQLKNKMRKGKGGQGNNHGPRGPPRGPPPRFGAPPQQARPQFGRRPMPGPGMNRPRQMPPRNNQNSGHDEMDETMRKLREMSK